MNGPTPLESEQIGEFQFGTFFNPSEIIDQLDLRRPIYRASTHYGHFGKKGLPWETTSRLAAFKQALKI